MSEPISERRASELNFERRLVHIETELQHMAKSLEVQQHYTQLEKRIDHLSASLTTFAETMKGSWESLRGEVSSLAALFAKQTERLGAINEDLMKAEGVHVAEKNRLETERLVAENAKLRADAEAARFINRIKNIGAPFVLFLGALAGLAVILWNYFAYAVQQAVQQAPHVK